MDFKELYMIFFKDFHNHTLNGSQVGPPEFISLHRMEKPLKNGHLGIIAQLHAIQALESPLLHSLLTCKEH